MLKKSRGPGSEAESKVLVGPGYGSVKKSFLFWTLCFRYLAIGSLFRGLYFVSPLISALKWYFLLTLYHDIYFSHTLCPPRINFTFLPSTFPFPYGTDVDWERHIENWHRYAMVPIQLRNTSPSNEPHSFYQQLIIRAVKGHFSP
jgi:hypothetical protein